MTLKMRQDIGNKLEAKTDNLEQTLSKEIQDLKQASRDAKYNNKYKFTRESQHQNIGCRRMNKRGGRQTGRNH